MPMPYRHIRSTVEAPVGRLVLAEPDRRNALGLEAMGEIEQALEALGADPAVRVIVISADGPAFSAGHDIAEMVDRSPEFYDRLFAQCTRMMRTIRQIRTPVIAQVHGIATAAGCQLVASCDLVIAEEGTRFATPGVRIGLFCSTPLVPISRAVGQKRAMEMLLTGEPISVQTAQSWGLVNRIAPTGGLEEAVAALVGEISRWDPDVIGIGKDAFYRQEGLDEPAAYEITEPIMAANAAGPEAQEGFTAFLEKRAPRWGERSPPA
jgi:enoyl-CoA hydratase/carnithine racemase